MGRRQAELAAEWRRAAADQAYRRDREGGEENLHPRAALCAEGVRQGLCRVQGRQVLADVREYDVRPRRHGRRATMADGNLAEGGVTPTAGTTPIPSRCVPTA